MEVIVKPTLNGFSVSCPPWNILLKAGFFLPFTMESMGSYTLIVLDGADVLTQHTRCRPRHTPVRKKLAWPILRPGRFASADCASLASSVSSGYEDRFLFDSTSSS